MKPISVKLSTPPQSSFKYKEIKLESFEFNWHCHREYEIMLMMKSKGKRFIGDSISHYDDGDLVLVGSNLPHTLYAPAGQMGEGVMHEAVLLQFPNNLAGLQIVDTPELHHLHWLFKTSSRGLRFRGAARAQAAAQIAAMSAMNGFGRFLQLLSILDTLARANEDEVDFLSSIEFERGVAPTQQTRIDQVCTYLNEDYDQRLKLEDAASVANMSITAFSRFFKRSTGKTFIRYVNELRIGHACRLLIESELSVAEICYRVGFNNVSNFNRRFRELHAMSPKQYRHEFIQQR